MASKQPIVSILKSSCQFTRLTLIAMKNRIGNQTHVDMLQGIPKTFNNCHHGKNVAIRRVVLACWITLSLSCRPLIAQQDDQISLPIRIQTNFNIFCDPNGGNTGTCWTFDQNLPLDCEYASQDFIQCALRSTKQLFICVNYASYQFACRPELDSGKSSIQNKTIRSDLRNPLQQVPATSQPVLQNQLHNDLLDVFQNNQ
jgi:hypothetical protein